MPHYLDARNGVTLSEAYAEAAAYAPSDRAIIYTYELLHPSFTERICIVNDYENITATLETGEVVEFIACPVQIVPPSESDGSEAPSISVAIDGVSAIVAAQLDAAAKMHERITLIERQYVSDDLSAPCYLPPLSLTLKTVAVNATRVTASASFTDPVNRGFPSKDYLIGEYPGLIAR